MTASSKILLSPNDVYDIRLLKDGLKSLGDYVYAYFEPKDSVPGQDENNHPFYVGKGRGDRLLAHWKNAIANNIKRDQCVKIRGILEVGKVPIIKVLAYNLEKTEKNDVYSVVERVLQNTFGIDRDKNVFDLRVRKDACLHQYRNDAKNHPVLTLEAICCKEFGDFAAVLEPELIAEKLSAPVLLVPLSKSFKPSYSQYVLSEMARMYWLLEGRKALPSLLSADDAVLAGWTSAYSVCGEPQICGIWRIVKGSFVRSERAKKRHECSVRDDVFLRKTYIGRRLSGTGHSYQNPRIFLPW